MRINQSEECHNSEVLNINRTFMGPANIVSLCTQLYMSPAVLFRIWTLGAVEKIVCWRDDLRPVW